VARSDEEELELQLCMKVTERTTGSYAEEPIQLLPIPSRDDETSLLFLYSPLFSCTLTAHTFLDTLQQQRLFSYLLPLSIHFTTHPRYHIYQTCIRNFHFYILLKL
jgi:hypothetical protein